MGPKLKFARPSTSILGIGAVGIVGAVAYVGWISKHRYLGTENYAIDFPTKLSGWKVMPNTPESLFVFKDVKTGYLLRGSVSQVISDVNPTPGLDTDAIAKNYVDLTHQNMPDWTAKRVDDMPGENVRFSVILRQRKEHTVITAFTVKGNTTFMVSLSAEQGNKGVITDAMGQLAGDLKLISLKESDMGGGKKAADDYKGPMPPG